MDRYLTQKEIELYQEKGIDLDGDKLISYRFSAIVNTKRVDFFNMALNKFLNDKMVYSESVWSVQDKRFNQPRQPKPIRTVECIKELHDNYYRVNTHKNSNSTPFYLQKQDGTYFLTEEDIVIEGVDHKRINFVFASSHPLIVVKIITDLKDAVDFVDQMYQYDHDGNEYLRMTYPIGSDLRFVSSISDPRRNTMSSGNMVTVMGYEYNREKFEVEYVVSDNGSFYFNTPEEDLYIDRDVNLNNLLGD